MRNSLKLKRGYSIWSLLWLALVFVLLTLNSNTEAVSKNKEIKLDICGEHLELEWSKTLFPLPSPQFKRGPITMQVLPSDENLMVHTIIWESGESSDSPRDIDTFLLDVNGKILWRRNYIDMPFVFSHGHMFTVGKQMYRYFDRLIYGGGDIGLRYHIWLDKQGFIQWVYAQKEKFNTDAFGENLKYVEIVNEDVYNLVTKCQNEFCQIDSLKITEKGVDPKNWQTIFHWPYTEDNKNKAVYHPVSVSTSHLLVYKKEKEGGERFEYHLIQFSSGGRIEFNSKYSSHVAVTKDKNGDIIVWEKDRLTRLDKTGRQIKTTKNTLSHELKKRGINATFQAIDQFKDGWLFKGETGINKETKGLVLIRLSADGTLLWAHSFNLFHVVKGTKDPLEFAGNDGENIFFSRQGTLYKCSEKQFVNSK